MFATLNVLAPMFVILGFGFAAGYAKSFRERAGGLNQFVFFISLPCFVYVAITTAELPDSFPWQVWVLAFVFPAVAFLLIYAVTHWLLPKHREHAAPLALSSTYGNVGYFGIPMTIALLGNDAAIPAVLVHLLHNLVFLVGYPLLRGQQAQQPSESSGRRTSLSARTVVREIVARVFYNPVTISTVLGLLVLILEVPVAAFINDSLELLGQTAIPLALFSVGIALHPALESLRSGSISIGLVVSGIGMKNIVFPMATVALVALIGQSASADWMITSILMAAMPMSTSGYILSERYDESGDLAAAILAGTTLLSIITIPALTAMVL
ncbi:AEC family transporter [Enteractinococcus fodinae]|uniref:Permease n=1 Tax=Enteractinococcus fodinae TaxID=684663 RepID=A0ABU2B2X5_9MICC|nr:AEC family transporter [Enteractinococcus fodinae]MDR7347945.1 putative permease [Enteractinococcus fodinae]